MNHTTEYLTTEELAKQISMSRKFIEKHRHNRIPGAVRIGGAWRFDKAEINKRLASGQFLLPKPERQRPHMR